MLNDAFVKEIASIAAKPQLVTLGGIQYLAMPDVEHGWVLQERDEGGVLAGPEPMIEPLTVTTLDGLVAYVLHNTDDLPGGALLHVVSPTSVVLRSALRPAPYRQRDVIAKAELVDLFSAGFRFGTYVDVETFIIQLMAFFEASDVRDQLLKMFASIEGGRARTDADDGISATVTVRQGLTLRAEARIENPVHLAPYRTFREIDQPVSDFLLRLRGGDGETIPTVTLFEADGGTWKLAAMQAIKAYLADKLAALAPAILA